MQNKKLSKSMLRFNFEDRKYAIEHNLIFDDVPLSTLSKGTYTFVITKDGKMSFGKVENDWEFGVKHYHIANGRSVYAAGELSIEA